MGKINPIHHDKNVQSIDVRIYFEADISKWDLMDEISEALSHSPSMISAYELVWDGFSHCTPATEPLA